MRIIKASVNHHYMVCCALILLNSLFLAKVARVTNGMQSRLEQLEVLYSEQDYTIQTLNGLVAQQDQEISLLRIHLEQLQAQLHSLRTELSGETESGFEPPPHY